MNWHDYHRTTRTATYGFLSALPLLLLYEVMILAVNQGRIAQVRIGAEVWLKSLLTLVGGTGLLVLGLGVIVAGAFVFWYDRDRSIPLKSSYFLGLIAESAVYAVVVAFLVSGFVGAIFAMAPAASPSGIWTELALSIGAGIYEELVFRVILVGGLYALLRGVLANPAWAYPLAAVVGAAIFSGVHYIGPFGDVVTLVSFMFRFVFGLALNVLFLWRGFGVAAWTHALYDVMLVTGLFRLLG
jgi:hypothetical protein